MRLALDRGRAGDSKTAPHADSGVSSSSSAAATAAAEQRDSEHAASGSAESRPGDNVSSSVRFRQELEVPAPRDVGGPRIASPRTTAAGGSGAGGWRTPAKVRLPPSHRRPKTPHADGTAAAAASGRHPAGTSKSSALAGEGGRHAEDKHAGGLATAAGGGAAVLASTHTNGNRGGGGRTPAATPERSRLERSMATPERSRSERSIGKKSLEQRKVLVPVQLGEVDERARPSATRGLPPAPSPRRLAPRAFGGKPGSTADSRTRPAGGGQGHREAPRGGLAGTKCPPSPSASGDLSRARGFGTKRQAADGNRGLRRKNSATALLPPSAGSAGEASAPVEDTPARRKTGTGAATIPSRGGGEANAPAASVAAAVAAAPPARTQEVAHLRLPKREASAGGGGEGGGGGIPKPYGLDEQGRHAEVPRASRGGYGEELLDSNGMTVSVVASPVTAAAAAAAAENERGTAAELAVHLISAHREDVRSALAAARRDMDLVSKADQDRQPAALLEYAREVEGVLGVRLAAGAKLRAALDSYVALRQASSGPGQEERSLPEGRARGARTVQA